MAFETQDLSAFLFHLLLPLHLQPLAPLPLRVRPLSPLLHSEEVTLRPGLEVEAEEAAVVLVQANPKEVEAEEVAVESLGVMRR